MKISRFAKVTISVLLVAVMALSFVACKKSDDESGGSNPGVTSTADKSKPTNVYREDAVSVSGTLENAWNMAFAGDRIYMIEQMYTDGSIESSVISVNLRGEDKKVHMYYTYVQPNYEENMHVYESVSFRSVAPTSEGTVWVLQDRYYEDYSDEMNPIYEQSMTLFHVSDAGEELLKIELADVLGDEYYYISNILADNGRLFVNADTSVLVFNSTTGELETKLELEEGGYTNQIIKLGDGTYGAVGSDYESTSRIYRIIPGSVQWGDTIEVAQDVQLYNAMSGDENYLLYSYSYGRGIFGLKADGTAEEIVNFLNSDISTDEVVTIARLDSGEFFMLSREYGGDRVTTRLSTLSKVPEDEIREAIMLTIATINTDYYMRRAVLDFNRSNGEYRFTIEEYGQYNTPETQWQGGYDRLSADLTMGKIPDVMSLEGMDVQNLANKGVLADLYPLIDGSEKYDREDYMPSVLQALSFNDKLYRFAPSFALATIVGKSSIVGDTPGWTFADMQRILREQPPGTQLFDNRTRDEILRRFFDMTIDQYINWEDGTTDFGENFAELLEFAKQFPETIDWEAMYGVDFDYAKYETQYRDGRVLLNDGYIDSFRNIRYMEERFGGEITFIGVPTESGNGSVIEIYNSYGVSARSKASQVCFDFLASMVEYEPDFASANGYFYGQFSISKDYMEAVAAYELLPLRQRPGYVPDTTTPDDGAVMPRTTTTQEAEEETAELVEADVLVALPMPQPEWPGEGEYDPAAEEAKYPLTQREIDMIMQLIENTTTVSTSNDAVWEIITSETQEFFAGRRDAMTTADMIQNRVRLFVSENS